MPLFGKKKSPAPEVPPTIGLAAPVVVKDGDLERVGELMQLFNHGVGSDAGMRIFGVAFNRAGGFISVEEAVGAVSFVRDPLQRPWLWLAAVEREALAQDNLLLVAQIALMAQFYSTQIAPHFTMAEFYEGIVTKPSDGALAQIHTVSLLALPGLPADTMVLENATGAIDAGTVMLLSASEVLKVESLIDASTVAAARQLRGH